MTPASTLPSKSTLKPIGANLRGQDGLGFDYALLGVKPRENRTAYIRRAASKTALRIRETESVSQAEEVHLLGELATSTYRLLDPRRRTRLLDRVQLSIFSEQDFDLQKRAERTPFRIVIKADRNTSRFTTAVSKAKTSSANAGTPEPARAKSIDSKRRDNVAATISKAGPATAVTLAWIMVGVAVSGLLAAGAL